MRRSLLIERVDHIQCLDYVELVDVFFDRSLDVIDKVHELRVDVEGVLVVVGVCLILLEFLLK